MSARRSSRRRWLGQSSLGCASALAAGWAPWTKLLAADGARAALNRFPQMMQQSLTADVTAIMARRKLRLDAVKTKADAEAYAAAAREGIQACFGPWPERTPLNAKITGVLDRDTYRVEKVILESRPQFFVTGNLYVPKGLTGKAPAVIGSCGHAAEGKAHETYQAFAQGLARQGYVVLLFDPIGQGERLQLLDAAGKPRVGIGVGEHMMLGNAQFLFGEFFGSWRAWDAMRVLDYLLTREEVDPRHVGITGNSGGGTMTTWLCGVEPRFTMAAAGCFVVGFLTNIENELPADTEQCPPGILAKGLDHGDFMMAMAPKPVAILSQEQDYFDARGATRVYEELRRFYARFGAEENVTLHVGPGGHGYHQDAREAMYRHFNRAVGRGDAAVAEPTIKQEEARDLFCTAGGQITELRNRPVYSFSKETAERLAKERGEVGGDRLREAVRKSVGTKAESPVEFRIPRPRLENDYPLPHVTTYVLGDDAGIETVVYRLSKTLHYSRPSRTDAPAILYVAHDSSDAELRSDPSLREMLELDGNTTMYACDVRGLGESRPNTCGEGSYYTPYGCDYFHAVHEIMLGRSYVAGRTADVLRAIDFVSQAGHRRIHVVAKGYGAIPAALASLLRPNVARVTLKQTLASYTEVAGADVYAWPLSSFLPGVLSQFDLPDVYRELEKTKQLRLIDPRGADKKPE